VMMETHAGRTSITLPTWPPFFSGEVLSTPGTWLGLFLLKDTLLRERRERPNKSPEIRASSNG